MRKVYPVKEVEVMLCHCAECGAMYFVRLDIYERIKPQVDICHNCMMDNQYVFDPTPIQYRSRQLEVKMLSEAEQDGQPRAPYSA